jgi:hypothetical protein
LPLPHGEASSCPPHRRGIFLHLQRATELGVSLASELWVSQWVQLGRSELTITTGYPMAKNLRAKIPEGDTLTIFDVNSASSEKLVKEAVPANIQIAKGPRDVAQGAVRDSSFMCCSMMSSYCSIYDLSSGPPSGRPFHDSLLRKPIL